MKRDLNELSGNKFDLAIIGGGIYGAAVVHEATLRGLSVALVERADFGAATSSNSLKIIHGGLRYLQHGDIRRVRDYICERRTLLRIAPHLVRPLPVLVPTYGHGVSGKELFTFALLINDLIGFDRNYQVDPGNHLPRGRGISRQAYLQHLPGTSRSGLTGGVLFYDAQVHNSERLTLAFLRSAAAGGAKLANYAEVTGFLRRGDRVTGIQVLDRLNGERLAIRARSVINTSGPWIDRVLDRLDGASSECRSRHVKAINLVTSRPIHDTHAFAVPVENGYRDRDAVIGRGDRLLFVVPWHGRSMIGTAYYQYDGDPICFSVTEAEITDFLESFNRAYPSAALTRDEITFVHRGLIPISGIHPETGSFELAKHHTIYDHASEGTPGLISVMGVKYTAARYVAERVLRYLLSGWGYHVTGAPSQRTSLFGGEIDRYRDFLSRETRRRPHGLAPDSIRELIRNYGAAYTGVLKYLPAKTEESLPEGYAVRHAEILHGIHEEMAQRLGDVIFRRTDLGSAGHPGAELIRFYANVMRQEMGWTEQYMEEEIARVNRIYRLEPA